MTDIAKTKTLITKILAIRSKDCLICMILYDDSFAVRTQSYVYSALHNIHKWIICIKHLKLKHSFCYFCY